MRDGTGIHRRHGVDGAPNIAWVVDRSISFEVGEMLYRQRGYFPPFDELEWREAGQPPTSGGDRPLRIDPA